jgi:hypothetical protein
LATIPAGQVVQLGLPGLAAIVPGGQTGQLWEPEPEKVPGGHAWQLVLPGAVE